MKYGSCLKKLKRILAVALALALLLNGWSNYDLSVKAEANEEETVEGTVEEGQSAEEEVAAEKEESTETQETQTVEETTGTEETSETSENTATAEETTEETTEAEETAATQESTEITEEAEEEETESLTIVESFSLGVARLLGGLSPVAGGISVASVEDVTVEVTGGSSTIDKDDNSANTVSLTASATLDGGGSATVTSWSWSSNNENVATVPDNDASTVTVTAGSNVGDATITATATVDSVTYKGTYTVTVKGNNSVASVTLGSLGEVSVNDATDNSPSEALSYGDEVTLSSVTMDDTTMSSGEVSFVVSSSVADSTVSTDVATKSSDTTFTVNQTGKFYLHITVAANSYYNKSTAVYCFDVQPKVLKVEKLDKYSTIEKDSDGTTALSSDNENSLYSITSYLKLTGQLSSDSDIKLAWSSNAGTGGEDIDWSEVVYDKADLTASVIKGFGSLDTYLTIVGTNKDYYKIDTDSLDEIELNAAINANKPDPDSYDMTTNEGTGGKVTISVNGSTAVELTVGTEGNEANSGEGDKYWYSEDGCAVKVETGSGFAIVDETYADISATAFTDDSTIFYITYTNGSAVTYYGPYTVSLQIDTDGPDLQVAGVQLSNGKTSLDNPLYYNLNVEYTISATDEQSSVDKIYYYLATADDEEVTATSATDWVEASLDPNGRLTVTMPSYGYLYVKAVDKVGNVTVNDDPYCLLVLESKAPTLAVECKTQSTSQTVNPEKSHTISVTVTDEEDTNTYSGIQYVYYTLVTSGSDDTNATKNYLYGEEGGSAPQTLNDRVQTPTISDEELTTDEDGTYTLTVYAADWCGNETKYDPITLDFDTTSPELSVSFDKAKTFENEVGYYNSSFDVTFTVTDNYQLKTENLFPGALKGSDSYSLQWTETVSGVADANGQYTYTATVTFPNTTEGEFYFQIVGTDDAGNALADATEETGESAVSATTTNDGSGFVSGKKVMDTTAPTVTAIACAQEAKGDDGEAYDDNNFYYNDSAVTLTFTLSDDYLPAESSNWTSNESISWAFTPIGSASSQSGSATGTYTYSAVTGTATVEFSLSAEGTYSGITLSGTDLAGNSLTLDDDYTHDICNTAEESGSAIVLTYGKVIDRTAPKTVINYSSSATGYIYDSSDDNAGNTGAVYYNDDVTVSIGVTDQYDLDDKKLYTTENSGNGTNVSGAAASYTVSGEDGTYYYGVYGTDRAGNALTVTEVIATPNSEGSEVTGAEQTECEDAYTSQYKIVLDQTAPTFVLAIDRSGATNKSLQAGRYYFNSDYTATVTVTETNFDSERIAVNCASGTATGTSAVTLNNYVASYDWSGSNPYTWTETVSAEGVYRYQMSGVDKAGNALTYSDATELQDTTNLLSYYIEVDKTNPTGMLTVNDYYEIDIASGSLSKSEPYRDETSATVNITTADLSPVLIGYTIDSTVDGTSAKSAGYGYQQTASTAVSGEQVFAVTGITVTDRAGNQISLGTTNSIYLDVTPPTMDTLAPTISVEAETNDSHHSAEGTPLFSKDVPLHIVVTDPYGGTRSSGLSTVTYQLYINGDEVTGDAKTLNPTSTTSWSNNYSDPTLTFTIDETITVDADSHNYNDIEVIVNAVDNAGNTNTRTYSFGIDTTAPTIEITYDNNDAENEKYFKAARTATIVVTERNFDSDLISISTESRAFSGWDYEAGSSANGDDDTWTATIAYNVDGDYTLTVEGEDLLGHEADVTYNGTAPREFTIDMTAPTIELTFDNNNVANGKYYNASRTATLTVTDVNFAGTSDIAVLASGGGAAPSFNFAGGYSSSATFSVDGVYSFSGTVTDLAGNVSLPVSCDEFVIDQTAPELEIFDIEDRSANNGEVRPGVRYSDTNYDASATSIVLTGYYNGVVEMNGTTTYTENGLEIKLDDFEYVQDMDDMYTMEAVVYDLAGNSSEDSVLFSVNRFGSVYIYDDDTAALVGEDGSYYTNEEQDIVVTETNVDTLEFKEITLNLDGSLTTLVEGEDYTVDESGTDVSWKQYTYTIDEENFVDEGTYIVTIYSEDRATNTSDNNTKGKKIEFVVDKTNPSILISGVEEDGQYREASREVTLDVEDNIQMAEVVVEVDGVETTYSASEVLDADGKIVMTVGSANHWQSIRVTALDVAGNVRTASVERFLITPNIFVQFYMNKVLFWSTVGVALLLALLAGRRYFLIAAKRRKKKEEE